MGKLTSSLVVSLTDRVSGPARGIMGTLGRLRGSAEGFNRNQMAMASGVMGNLKALMAAAAAYVSLTQGISNTVGAAIKFEDTMSDIRKVVDNGIRPVLTTGIAHREAGVGQIGAGIVRTPMACYAKAVRALARKLGVAA